MTVELTLEEKRVVAKLIEKLKQEDAIESESESAAEFASTVSKLAEQGLTDQEIADELSEGPVTKSLQGRLAIARMERCM